MNIPQLIEDCRKELTSSEYETRSLELLDQLLSVVVLLQQGYEELNPHALNSKYIDLLRDEIYSLQNKLNAERRKHNELNHVYDDLKSDFYQLQHDYDVVKGQLEVYHRMKGSLEVVDTTLPI